MCLFLCILLLKTNNQGLLFVCLSALELKSNSSNAMEKYYYLDEEKQDTGGASFDDRYTFRSSLPIDYPSFDHKPLLPLLLDKQTSTSLPSLNFHTPFFSSNDFHPKFESIANSTTFKVPKTEPEDTGFVEDSNHISNQPSVFHLPNLSSLEENLDIESILQAQSPNQLNSPLSPCATQRKYLRQRNLARQRRQRVREKIESLKDVLPAQNKKKMDTATVLENAGKYIKFLEAQVNVLEAMPVNDCLITENMSLNKGGGGLDRNRVLQIMVNSEVSQGKMSSEGMCVYSVEQLVQMIGRLFTSEEASLLLNSILFSSFTPH